ncbi:hypothetical protein [Shimia thalassica]|uniref:hypothetical protein n=1 Tax=Shimia thalassica TaxID=1715693 RepID=UPI0026E28F7A|nr:hypothetical protein [Shimia thalassica]MDO6480951.1 hypothetical protein [Shimia thalassica]
MHFRSIAAITLLLSTFPAWAETVQTTDGRVIELRDDGTYEILEADEATDTTYVEHQEHFFEHHAGEYGQKRVRFMPIYKNVSDKKIIGTKFTARFLSAFGDEIFVFSGESNEAISPGQSSTNKLFYYFEDNQFIPGEAYDKLMPMVTNGSGTIEVSLTKIAFEGGEIVKLSD